MDLIKKLSFLLIIFTTISSLSLATYAEEVHFQGQIVEFTCEKDSNNSNCKVIDNTIDVLRKTTTLNSFNFNNLIEKKANSMAHLKIQDLESDQHKILVVDYY